MIVLLLGLAAIAGSSVVLVPLLDDPEEPTYDRVMTAGLVVVCVAIVLLVALRGAEALL